MKIGLGIKAFPFSTSKYYTVYTFKMALWPVIRWSPCTVHHQLMFTVPGKLQQLINLLLFDTKYVDRVQFALLDNILQVRTF